MENNADLHPLTDWIPYRLSFENGQPLVHWLYLADHTFDEPFFEDTVVKCKEHAYNSGNYRSTGSLESLIEWAQTLPDIQPAAFIFHISRCGSTLLSQLLAMNTERLVLSEAPFFDELLRLPFRMQIDPKLQARLLQAAIRITGKKRKGKGKQLFIKTDSWHIFFEQTLRSLYPHTPFILLYRSPDEVLYSHQKMRGMQAVPGLIQPEVFGFTKKELAAYSQDEYTARVLENYISAFGKLMDTDKQSLLLDYKQGAMAMMESIAGHLHIRWSESDLQQMEERSRFHSKHPGQNFKEPALRDPLPDYLRTAMSLYQQLDQKRAAIYNR